MWHLCIGSVRKQSSNLICQTKASYYPAIPLAPAVTCLLAWSQISVLKLSLELSSGVASAY